MDLTSYITDFKLFSDFQIFTRSWENHIYIWLFQIRWYLFYPKYVSVSVVYESASKTVYYKNIFFYFGKRHFDCIWNVTTTIWILCFVAKGILIAFGTSQQQFEYCVSFMLMIWPWAGVLLKLFSSG